MKKYFIVTSFMIIVFILLSTVSTFAMSSILNNINLNNLDLNSIDESKIDDLKDVLENIDTNSLDSSSIINDIDKSEIASGNLNSIDVNDISINEVISLYNQVSDVISNEELANLIKDNSELLTDAGISSEALSASETLLRTFDADAVIDIIQNDLDLDELLTMYKNGASLTDILTSVINETSLQTKINIVYKLLFSNFYVRLAFVVLIFVAIYSIFITSIIFNKAGKPKFATIIPIYRDVLHLKICGLSPWLLLLVFIPILGWLMLAAVAIIGRFELAKRFGHGFLFGLGLLFIPILFRTIIAFSSNEYIEELYEDD